MDMVFQTAIYVGVHLISWQTRSSDKRRMAIAPDVTGLMLGREFTLNGWEQDRGFFLNGELAPIFLKVIIERK